MYLQIEAPVDLKNLISFFYVMELEEKEKLKQPLLPSLTPIMGWQYKGFWEIRARRFGNKEEKWILPEFYTVGQQTVSYTLRTVKGTAGIMGAALHPDALWQMFNKPAKPFTNVTVSTTELFDKILIDNTVAAFKKSETEEKRLEVLVQFYRTVNKNISVRYTPVRDAVDIIFQERGAVSVRQIAEKMRLNERYLQRYFNTIIGLTPHQYIQMVRFNNIFIELTKPQDKQNLRDLAVFYNYYDLPHFNKEFKKYFGFPPSGFILDNFILLRDLIQDTPYLLEVQKQHLRK